MILPWYNPDLISFLEGFLSKEMDVFEYGGGFSTIYYSKKVASVSTIETTEEWLQKILSYSPQNLEIKLCTNLPNFANEISNFTKKTFDVIIVDSRDRAKCLEVAPKFLKSSGMIILDNSERPNLIEAKENLIKGGFYEKVFSGVRSDGVPAFSSVFFQN